jgi:hypothetical protein
MTQPELAAIVGYSQQMISHWESGVRSPREDQLRKIADALQVPLTELLGEETEPDWNPKSGEITFCLDCGNKPLKGRGSFCPACGTQFGSTMCNAEIWDEHESYPRRCTTIIRPYDQHCPDCGTQSAWDSILAKPHANRLTRQYGQPDSSREIKAGASVFDEDIPLERASERPERGPTTVNLPIHLAHKIGDLSEDPKAAATRSDVVVVAEAIEYQRQTFVDAVERQRAEFNDAMARIATVLERLESREDQRVTALEEKVRSLEDELSKRTLPPPRHRAPAVDAASAPARSGPPGRTGEERGTA